MSDFSKILVGVSLLGKWVFLGVARANNLNEMSAVRSGNLELEQLTLSGALNKSTLNLEAGSDISLGYVLKPFNIFSDNDLKTLDEGAVSEFDKAEVFAARSGGLSPPGHSDDLVHELFVRVEQLSNSETVPIGCSGDHLLLDDCWDDLSLKLAQVLVLFSNSSSCLSGLSNLSIWFIGALHIWFVI